MAGVSIRPTANTRRALRRVEGATRRLNRELAFGLTAALDDQRADLLGRWRNELRTLHPFTERGLRWEAARPGATAEGRLFITRRVWRYLELQIEGGTRNYPRGFVVYFPGVSRSERRRFNARDRIELRIKGGRNRLVLQRGPGRNRPLGIRIFSAKYIKRASGGPYVETALPGFIEARISEVFDRHSDRAG